MNKLSIKQLVEFKRLSERRQRSFINKLKEPIAKEQSSSDGGGDYWVRSISAISMAFKHNDNSIIKERLDYLIDDFNHNQRNQTKIMYKRNIDILNNYKDFDFTTLRPSSDLKFQSKPKDKALIEIKGLPIQIRPSHVFLYESKGNLSVGSIWFVTWLEGFNFGDLAIFAEALFRYLSIHYSKDYEINPAACMAVDVSEMQVVGYNELLNEGLPSLLDSTINSVKERIR